MVYTLRNGVVPSPNVRFYVWLRLSHLGLSVVRTCIVLRRQGVAAECYDC